MSTNDSTQQDPQEHDAAATAALNVTWPPAELDQKVDALLDEFGYYERGGEDFGRLSGPLVRKLGRLARQQPTPQAFIKDTPAGPGHAYATTGLSSIQPQIDLANAIFGEAHWRWVIQPQPDDAATCLVTLVIGNDLHHPDATFDDDGVEVPSKAQVLVSHTLAGSNPNGSNAANRMKGALTNAGKRLLAQVGCCSDVYRFGDEDAPASGSGSPGQRSATSGTDRPSGKQLDYLSKLLAESARGDLVRMRGHLKSLANHANVDAPELEDPAAFLTVARQLASSHLTRGQVGEIIQATKDYVQGLAAQPRPQQPAPQRQAASRPPVAPQQQRQVAPRPPAAAAPAARHPQGGGVQAPVAAPAAPAAAAPSAPVSPPADLDAARRARQGTDPGAAVPVAGGDADDQAEVPGTRYPVDDFDDEADVPGTRFPVATRFDSDRLGEFPEDPDRDQLTLGASEEVEAFFAPTADGTRAVADFPGQ